MTGGKIVDSRFFQVPKWYSGNSIEGKLNFIKTKKNVGEQKKISDNGNLIIHDNNMEESRGNNYTINAIRREIPETSELLEYGDQRVFRRERKDLNAIEYIYNHLLSMELSTVKSEGQAISVRDMPQKKTIWKNIPQVIDFPLSPLSLNTRKLLKPYKFKRNISKSSRMILDAPGIVDDFYLNLIDWSKRGPLAVALQNQIYMWDIKSKSASRWRIEENINLWTSICWNRDGKILGLGCNYGNAYMKDGEVGKTIFNVERAHSARIGAISWNGNLFSTGGRDNLINNYDLRSGKSPIFRIEKHVQEVCGLKWDPLGIYLASGGNDNLLYIWDKRSLKNGPLFEWKEHTAAVKALDWCPVKNNYLASGGGTLDKNLRLWDIKKGKIIAQIDTGSQICNMKWSPMSSLFDPVNSMQTENLEIVTSQGYTQNQLILWRLFPLFSQVYDPSSRENNLNSFDLNSRCNEMKKFVPLQIFNGHSQRVIHMALDPITSTIVTGSGDETLRFWNVFDNGKKDNFNYF